MLKMLWFLTKSTRRRVNVNKKNIPKEAEEGGGQAPCSACMTSSRKAPLHAEAHSPETLLVVGSDVTPNS